MPRNGKSIVNFREIILSVRVGWERVELMEQETSLIIVLPTVTQF